MIPSMEAPSMSVSRVQRLMEHPAHVAFFLCIVGWASEGLFRLLLVTDFPAATPHFLQSLISGVAQLLFVSGFWFFGLEVYWLGKASFRFLRGKLDRLAALLLLAAFSHPGWLVWRAFEAS